MAGIEEYSTTAANNDAAVPNGWPEGQTPASVNNCARELMARLAILIRQFPWIDLGYDVSAGYTAASITRNSNTQFQYDSIDLSAYYSVGRRIKVVGVATQYGYISAVAFGTHTVIDVTMDGAAALTTSITNVYVSTDDANTIGTAAVRTVGSSSANLPDVATLLATVFAYTAQQYFAEATLSDGANISWDLDSGQSAKVTLGGNRTLDNPSNQHAGGTYVLKVIQDGTGSRTLAFGTAYDFAGSTPDMSGATAAQWYILSFYSDGTKMSGAWQGPYG